MFRKLFLISVLCLGIMPVANAVELADGWMARESPLGALLVSASFADDQVGWASGIRAIIRTSNGGRTWHAQWNRGGNESYWFNNIAALSRTEAMASAFPYGRDGGGVVLRTEDGGDSWQPVTVSNNPNARFSSLVFRPDGQTGFVISTTDGLMATRDGGHTWTAVRTPRSVTRVWVATRCNISLPDDETLIVGADGALLRSNDDGQTWEVMPLPDWMNNPQRQFMWVRFATPEFGYVYFLNGDTLVTDDGGATWERSEAPGQVFFKDQNLGYALTQYDVHQTEDGGATWSQAARVGGGRFGLSGMAFTSNRALIFGGSEGTGTAFIATRLLPGAEDDSLPSGVVPITFNMPESGYATIQILDENDNVVQNVVAGQAFEAGEQTVWWDLSTLDDFWTPFNKSRPFLWDPPQGAQMVADHGQYRWRGIWHPGLTLDYQFSYYPLKKHNLPWITADRTGGWLSDHQPPQDVIRAGDTMWAGSFTEAGHALLEADPDMRKLWGSARIELACPRVLATEGDYVYFIEEGGWLGFAGRRAAVIRVNRHNKSARMVFAVGTGEERAPEEDIRGVRGLAVRQNRVYIACQSLNAIQVADISHNDGRDRSLRIVASIPLESPGRIRPYDDTRLAAVSGKSVVLIDYETHEITPVITDLTNPLGLGIDGDKRFYVGEMEPLHQVRVFSAEGELLRTIGKPGGHDVGPFDPHNLESPAGIDIDPNGNVWVCEANSHVKRTSVWDAAGRNVNQVLGPAVYGGGGEIDPQNPNRLFYQGHEFHRDPETGEITLVNIIWRYDDDRYDRFVDYRSHNFGGPAPSYPFWRDGKLYFTMWGGWGMGHLTTLWVYDEGHARPIGAVGEIPPWFSERLGEEAVEGKQIFAWTDRNDDGRVQPDEVQLSSLRAGGAVWGVRMNSNFEVAFSTVAGDVGVAFFKPGEFTPQGYPVWQLPTEYTMVPNFRTWDPSQVQGVYTDRHGNAVIMSPYIMSISPEGNVNWRYICRWPGLHAGVNTTATGAEPGVIIGPIRFYGSGVVNEDIGEVICIGTNFGATDLFTEDGLYVGRAFQDNRRAEAWAFNSPPTSEQLARVSLSQEHFGGTFQRVTDDEGNARFLYVVAGDNVSCNVIELHGLDNIRRFPESELIVTPEHWLAAEQLRQERAAELIAPRRYTVPRMTNVTIDGHPREWGRERINGFALGFDDTHLYLLHEGRGQHGERAIFQNASDSTNYTEAFKHGAVVDLMLGTNADANPDRRQPAAGDIRLSFTMVDGEPTAILYEFVVPGTPDHERHTFASPWQAVHIDRISRIAEAKIAVTRQNDQFTLEAAVPLAALGLDPAQMQTLRGDVGVVVGDATGTRAIDRIYWSNPSTKTVADLPTEASIQPHLWGTFVFDRE